MKESLLTFLLAVFASLCSIAAETVRVDGIDFELNDADYSATVIGPRDFVGDLVIPETVFAAEGTTPYTVKYIGSEAFAREKPYKYRYFDEAGNLISEDVEGIRSITIPATVEEIGNRAFYRVLPLEYLKINGDDTPLTLGLCSFALYPLAWNKYTENPDRYEWIWDEFEGLDVGGYCNIKTIYYTRRSMPNLPDLEHDPKFEYPHNFVIDEDGLYYFDHTKGREEYIPNYSAYIRDVISNDDFYPFSLVFQGNIPFEWCFQGEAYDAGTEGSDMYNQWKSFVGHIYFNAFDEDGIGSLVTRIGRVDVDGDAAEEVYTIQGVKVDATVAMPRGIYIVKRGFKVSKEIR